MENYRKYFLSKISKGFAKNLIVWKNECDDYTKFDNADLSALNVYKFYFPNSGNCQHPECSKPTKFISISKGFRRTCCRKHAMELTSLNRYGVKYKSQLPEFKEQVKNTVQAHYGVDNVFQSNEIKNQIKETNLEIYGFENAMKNAMKNDMVKNKCRVTTIERHGGLGFQTGKNKNTMLELYGYENPSQITEFQEKKKKTFINKFGVDHPMKNKDIQEKTSATNLKRYGVDHIMKLDWVQDKVSKTRIERYSNNHWMHNPEVIEKRKETYLSNYGVEHPMQNKEIFEKNLKSCYKTKEYVWKTGEISTVQGHEPIVLKELEETGYSYNDVKTSSIEIPDIWYYYKGKKHKYYPDFYIPKENLIIEVKSDYTYNNELEKNLIKFDAVKDAGYEFRLEIR